MKKNKLLSKKSAERATKKNSAHKIREKLLVLLRSDLNATQLKKRLDKFHEKDIAEAFQTLTFAERKKLYSRLGDEFLSEIFCYFDDPEPFINELTADKAADIVELMPADDAVDILDELDDDKKNRIIDLMDKESAEDVKLISAYPDDEIGSLMTTDFVSVPDTFDIKQAMASIVEQAAENDNISTIFITDENGCFTGATTLRKLFIARSTCPLKDIVTAAFPFLYATDKTEDVLQDIKEYSEECLPVLDADNRLIGALTSADVIEVVGDEMSEDYAKLAGLSESEDLNENAFTSVKKRIPWLMLLLVMSVGVSAVIGLFDSVIAALPLIVLFQPMILDMSGNSGSQSLGVTIRRLATDDLGGKAELKLALKEVLLCFFNGLILAAVCVPTVGLYLTLKGETVNAAFKTSAVTGAALLISMTISGLVGTVTPTFFKKIGIDPAAASGPLITTLNDLLSAITYYGLAYLILLGAV